VNDTVYQSWTALDGDLVFDIAIDRDPQSGVASIATVRCRSSAPEERVVAISERRMTSFDFRFRSGCYVRGQLQLRRNVHVEGVGSIGVFADIRFGLLGQHRDAHFEGLMVACPSHAAAAAPPAPPTPPPPLPDRDASTDSEIPLPIIRGQRDELFPYVYVRRWPRVTEEDRRYGFIQYAVASPPGDDFFGDLVAACRGPRGRTAAEALALRFIDGGYGGAFVGRLSALSGPVRDFANLALGFCNPVPSEGWPFQLCADLNALLARYGETPSYFSGAAYTEAIDRIWQSYFALAIVLGYEPALLEELTLSLWLAHVIAQAMLADDNGGLMVADLTQAQSKLLAQATVALPPSAFPLPPAVSPGSPPACGQDGWIEPYAIGDLQMVRQRLVRYAAGEIARIENVMRGERKEISSRRKRRQLDYREETGREDQVLSNDLGNQRTSLIEHASRTVAERTVNNQYNNFQTNYGPPTQATLNGSWTRTRQGGDPGVDDTTRFAREILNKTVTRIAREVGIVRASSTLCQEEDAVVSVIDNSSGAANTRAVFRWVNKVYEACVVNYGNRLMIELMVLRPAAEFIAGQAALAGRVFDRPIPPARLGIDSFEQITRQNYARLCARYGVTEPQPPPPAQKFATAALRSGETTQIAVPVGYGALKAFVGCVTTPPNLPPPLVMVGTQMLTPGPSGAELQPCGEDLMLPVSVESIEPRLSPPADADALVNVEVQCVPTAFAMEEWQIGIYHALTTAYREQAARYYGQAATAGARPTGSRSPLANRQIEQRALKNACIRLLLERRALLTGETPVAAGSPPSPQLVNEPRCLQFLEEALEWTEMAYSFNLDASSRYGDDDAELPDLLAGGDALFGNFLQATQARILLPVQPDRLMAFLYFYSSGMIWDGRDGLIAVDDENIALINDVKHSAPQLNSERQVGPCWEIVVLTAMQILDDAAGTMAGGGAILAIAEETA